MWALEIGRSLVHFASALRNFKKWKQPGRLQTGFYWFFSWAHRILIWAGGRSRLLLKKHLGQWVSTLAACKIATILPHSLRRWFLRLCQIAWKLEFLLLKVCSVGQSLWLLRAARPHPALLSQSLKFTRSLRFIYSYYRSVWTFLFRNPSELCSGDQVIPGPRDSCLPGFQFTTFIPTR